MTCRINFFSLHLLLTRNNTFTEETVWAKPKVGVSMLYSLGEPYNRMVKRLATLETKYIEILDDGTHDLNKARIAQLREAAKSYDLNYSVHAPFADINIGSPAKPMLAAGLKRLKPVTCKRQPVRCENVDFPSCPSSPVSAHSIPMGSSSRPVKA